MSTVSLYLSSRFICTTDQRLSPFPKLFFFGLVVCIDALLQYTHHTFNSHHYGALAQ